MQKTRNMLAIEYRLDRPLEEVLPELLATHVTIEGVADYLRSIGCQVSYATIHRWFDRLGIQTIEQEKRREMRKELEFDGGYYIDGTAAD